VWQVAAGVVLWGLHMGATQGLLSTLVVDAAPADLRGTALGMFNLITEVAYSLESLCSECCPGKPTANKARPLSSTGDSRSGVTPVGPRVLSHRVL
jgi:hypothetical protein